MLKFRKMLSLTALVAAAILIAATYSVIKARAVNGSLWLEPTVMTLSAQAGSSSAPDSINGNTDCISQSNSACSITTGYGQANIAGAVKLNGTSSYYPVRSYIDNREHFIAIPNSNTAISYTAEPTYGLYFYFNYNFSSSVKLISDGTGTHYQMLNAPDGKLANKSGQRLAADYGSASFSENGEWMVVSQPNVAMLRVNLRTFEVMPFAEGFDYTIGLNPAPQTAITNDGRYAVVASKDFNRFNIYDLQNCSDSACQSRDLQAYMRSQLSNYSFITNARFLSEDTVSFYSNTNGKISKYIVTAGSGQLHRQDYLALGDSYISGEGEFDYLPGTDTEQNTCHVSPLSYPLLAANELNFNSYHSVACSGAVMEDLVNTSDNYIGQAKPSLNKAQLKDQLSGIINNFQQGYIDQLDFVKTYQPQDVTVSIAGNDIGFSSILQSCTSVGTCYDTYEDRLELVQSIQRQFDNLVNTYTKLKNAGAADSRIYVMAYPQIAKPGGDCAANVHFNNDELIFASQLIDYLDTVIKSAAAKAGVYYVDNEDALYGHRMCEAGPGSVAMNGLTAGNDFPDKIGGPIGRESYHPNVFGHQLLENKLLILTNNLKAPMPDRNLATSAPSYDGLAILNLPHSGRQIKTTEFDPGLTPDLAYQNTPLSVTLSGSDYALAADAPLQAELHSTPINLGSFKTDSSGSLSTSINIPGDVPAGYHSLHIYGNDITGQQIDIYKSIYVAHTADDYDGNDINDSQQACIGIDPSGQDADKDGLDDACDANITQSPQAAEPSDFSGSVSSATASLIVFTPNNSSQADLGEKTSSSQNSSPKVLASHSSVTELSKASHTPSNFRINESYFTSGGFGIFLLSSLGYFIKTRLF